MAGGGFPAGAFCEKSSATLSPRDRLRAGYEIVNAVGRGGFGVVYRARQLTIDREVAIKVDTRVILDDRDQRRFLREVRAAGRLSGHPHVVEIYDAGVLPDSRPTS